jgi:hypothetical protein
MCSIISCDEDRIHQKKIISDSNFEPTESCSYNKENFDIEFFPFELEDFNLLKASVYFDKSTKIDSVIGKNKFYYFEKYPSKFSVVVYDTLSRKAQIDTGSIKSNFFKPKNGMRIGMDRNEFLERAGLDDNNCQTFTIVQNSMMYHFTFNQNKLTSIDFDGL